MEIITEIRPGRTLHLVIYPNPDSDTTVFFIHGLGGRGDQWREQINFLKKNYTLVIPDLLGHGKSDKPNLRRVNPFSFTELSQDLQIIFTRYANNKNIILGHSYGGALATSLALTHQNQISKLILISPTPCSPGMTIPLLYRFPAFVMTLFQPLLNRRFEKLAFTAKPDPALIALESGMNRLNSMRVIKQVVYGMQQMPMIDLMTLHIPVLIMVGEPDWLVAPGSQRKFYKKIPNHEFITIPNASHMALLERSDMVNQAIMNFLKNSE
jgi:pimeloyl-ACP methyl ester carboxylesterase